MALVFWAVRGGICLIVLWEFLQFRWMTWVVLALFLAITPFGWVGVRLRRVGLSKYRYPLNILRILVVVVLIELLVSQLTHHFVNPAPMLGAVLIGIGVLLLLFSLLEPPAGVGSREGVPTIVTDVVALTLLVLMLFGVVGIGASPFSGPRGVYVSATGAVFVADTANNRVVMVYKNGVRTTIGADLASPADVVPDGGNDGYLYIADAGNDRIERVNGLQPQIIGDHSFNYALADPATQQTTLALTGLNDPQSVSVDGVGNVFIADTGSGRIVEWHHKSNRQSTFMSGLESPLAVMCDPFFTQIVYVADTGAGTVLEVLPNHKVVTVLEGLDEPAGLAEDPWGNLYVSEMGSGVVLEAPNHGFGPATIIERNLGHPRGLSVDALGNLFIADTTTGQVKVVAHLREHHLVTHGIPGPTAVAYAPSGAVYVVDEHQGWLQEWDQGRLTTVATGLAQPVGVAPGPSGAVWWTSTTASSCWSRLTARVASSVRTSPAPPSCGRRRVARCSWPRPTADRSCAWRRTARPSRSSQGSTAPWPWPRTRAATWPSASRTAPSTSTSPRPSARSSSTFEASRRSRWMGRGTSTSARRGTPRSSSTSPPPAEASS